MQRQLIAECASSVVAEHIRHDNHAGNGYSEPREAWIDCSCGAIVWTWQQFYNETDEDPDFGWIEHLSYMTVNRYLIASVSDHLPDGVTTCDIPDEPLPPMF